MSAIRLCPGRPRLWFGLLITVVLGALSLVLVTCVSDRWMVRLPNAIVSELGGEKICIVCWEKLTERFIASVLGPLRVISVALDQATREAKVRAEKGSNWPSTWSGLHPDFELRTKLPMDLTGRKLRLNVQDEN